jgi:hypothetical protein
LVIEDIHAFFTEIRWAYRLLSRPKTPSDFPLFSVYAVNKSPVRREKKVVYPLPVHIDDSPCVENLSVLLQRENNSGRIRLRLRFEQKTGTKNKEGEAEEESFMHPSRERV